MANAFTQYLKETRQELNHVAWPTRPQTIAYAGIVIAICLFTAAYLGGLDALLGRALDYVIQNVH